VSISQHTGTPLALVLLFHGGNGLVKSLTHRALPQDFVGRIL